MVEARRARRIAGEATTSEQQQDRAASSAEQADQPLVEQSELQHEWQLVDTPEALMAAVSSLVQGHGPIGVDAERASGFRYYNNAYLIQFSRRGAGTYLIDPPAVGDVTALQRELGEEEWVLHAASQDLPCLRELGLDPINIFDTELAARLLGFERVGLGAVVEQLLGIHLQKAHSAADWSTRPLPEAWLDYAAYDVSLLPDLRDRVLEKLQAAGKENIAQQEFQATLDRQAKPPVAEPWRKLSGSNKITGARGLAIGRELWNARDELARERDTAPGRLLPDSSIVHAAMHPARSQSALGADRGFSGRTSRSELPRWWAAVLAGKTTEDLPSARPASGKNTMPHHRGWPERFPEADARLKAIRPLVEAEAERLNIPLENLLTPEYLRRLAWQPPQEISEQAVRDALQELGARPWQLDATAPIITQAFVDLV